MNTTHRSQEQNDLLSAALQYCAVADWYESSPCRWRKAMSEEQAMALFDQVEAQLRQAGARALTRHGHRQLVLEAVGVPEEGR